ncbi:MAG: DUF3450 domain-containing protein [Desulfuromonadaceae bacterium]|nr:DUF3450 domain-containing protein [Desulfuromonadaceae bacterium]
MNPATTILLAALVLSSLAGQASAADPSTIEQQSVTALKREIATQSKVEQWSEQRQALVNELLDQKTQLEWNRFQTKKYHQYVDHKQATIADLKRQKEQMTLLRKELEPFLDSTVATLHDAIASDMPFLAQERQERLAFLDQSLTDPDLALSEKLRRVLEAVQVEADYGNSVEVTEQTLPLAGGDTMVQVVRLGRIGLFYLSPDGNKVGLWDREARVWSPLPDDYRDTVRVTIDMIEQKRAAELIELPLPDAMRAAGGGA